jgi:RsiW-degrading membrane proteinase PrsW (M82 family)
MSAIEALPSVLGAAAVVPGLLYLISLTLIDNKPEPPFVVVASFFLGALSISLLGFLHPEFGAAIERAMGEVFATFSEAFLGVAVPEEFVKALVLIVFCRPFIANRHPIEGVIYGAAVGLGFAAAENLLLLAYRPWDWSAHFVARSVLTVPLHGALGVIAGIYVSRAHYAPMLSGAAAIVRRGWMYVIAWLLPVSLHGLYDFPLLLALDDDPLNLSARTLRTTGFVIALAVIIKAAELTYRTAEAQYALPGPYGAGSRGDARYWRQHIIGGLAGVTGALMVLIEVRDWLQGAPFLMDRHIFVLLGAALVAVGTLHHSRAAEHRRLSIAGTPTERPAASAPQI